MAGIGELGDTNVACIILLETHSIFRHFGLMPTSMSSCVVYSIPCKVYIGRGNDEKAGADD